MSAAAACSRSAVAAASRASRVDPVDLGQPVAGGRLERLADVAAGSGAARNPTWAASLAARTARGSARRGRGVGRCLVVVVAPLGRAQGLGRGVAPGRAHASRARSARRRSAARRHTRSRGAAALDPSAGATAATAAPAPGSREPAALAAPSSAAGRVGRRRPALGVGAAPASAAGRLAGCDAPRSRRAAAVRLAAPPAPDRRRPRSGSRPARPPGSVVRRRQARCSGSAGSMIRPGPGGSRRTADRIAAADRDRAGHRRRGATGRAGRSMPNGRSTFGVAGRRMRSADPPVGRAAAGRLRARRRRRRRRPGSPTGAGSHRARRSRGPRAGRAGGRGSPRRGRRRSPARATRPRARKTEFARGHAARISLVLLRVPGTVTPSAASSCESRERVNSDEPIGGAERDVRCAHASGGGW